MMKLKIHDGIIYTDEGVIVGTVIDSASEEVVKAIEAGFETVEAVKEFIDKINSGTFKPRAAVKEFERILDKYELNK